MSYRLRDLYGDQFGITTFEESVPEASEQAAIAHDDTNAVSAKVNSIGIMTWLGVLILFVVLLQFGGK